ncbi:hypothetical protein [Luteolibacter sp. Populi]|uniref:hypothetical protein n=1 Tax=Luteolibacter sp. Populi TaxID=3230487 RepID=UPI003465047F
MKALLRKKWFHITAGIVLAGGVLLAIAYAIANCGGAEDLQKALAEARAAGLPLTRAEMDADLPPPEKNAALHGILKEWEDAVARPLDPGNEELLAPLKAFAKPEWSLPWQKPQKPPKQMSYRDRIKAKNAPEAAGPPFPALPPGSADLRQMKKSDGYGQEPVSFLEEFERRHGAVLQLLQQDLVALPELRRPLAEESPLVSDLGYDRLARRCYRIHAALALRAEAALQIGQPGLAAESIALSLKLAEALGSRGPDGTYAMSSGLRATARPLKAGITRHQWRAEDLERIAAALKPMDLRRAVQRDVDATLLMLRLWERWKEDRHDFRNQGHLAFEITDARPLEYGFVRNGGGRLLPRGWFDWNAADLLRTTVECHRLAKAPGPLLAWGEGAERLRVAHYPYDNEKKHYLLIAFPHATEPLSTGARAMVQRDLMLVACAVEQSYVEHRTYPAALPPGVPEDALLELPFVYRVKPEGGFEVYSLGPNGKDDSVPGPGKRRGGDWVW